MKFKKKHLQALFYCLFFCSVTSICAQFDPSDLDSLGVEIDVALNKKDGSFDQYFDVQVFANRILLRNPKRPEIRKLNKEMRQGFSRLSMSNILYKSPIDYKYKYIGTKKDSSMVVRQWDLKDGGFNYLLLKADYIEEKWVIIGIYVLLSAEYMSTTLKNSIYMPSVIRLIDKKRGRKGMSNLEIQLEAASLFKENEYQLAYNKISNIPLEERQKTHQIFKINIASLLDDDKRYYKSIDEFKERFPEDLSVELILMDKYLIEGSYDKLYGALDAIEDFVLQDNFLNYYRSLTYLMEEDYKNAEKTINLTIEEDKTEEVYHWLLVQIYAAQGKYKTCIKLIKGIGQQFQYNKTALKDRINTEFYFLSISKPYRRWCKQKK